MIKRVFVDSDVILEIALGQKPFLEGSKMSLSLLENNIALAFISAISIANTEYLLSSEKIWRGFQSKSFNCKYSKILNGNSN